AERQRALVDVDGFDDAGLGRDSGLDGEDGRLLDRDIDGDFRFDLEIGELRLLAVDEDPRVLLDIKLLDFALQFAGLDLQGPFVFAERLDNALDRCRADFDADHGVYTALAALHFEIERGAEGEFIERAIFAVDQDDGVGRDGVIVGHDTAAFRG